MFGFKRAGHAKRQSPAKANWKDIHGRHTAALEAERHIQESTPQPPSRKKVGFGKRRKDQH